jgi:hypothetical protein
MISLKHLIATAALAGAIPAGAAHAAEFTLFIYETPADYALRTDPGAEGQAYWAAYGGFAKTLQDSGAIRGGGPLQVEATARTIRAGKTIDGAYAVGDLVLGGYFKIEAPDMSAAEAIAAQAPSASRGGAVEIRPGFVAPAM